MKANKFLVFVPVQVLSLAGCATLERGEVLEREQWLAQAGFQARPAKTAEQFSNLASLPKHKLVSKLEDGHSVYSYADPDYCRCVYVGGPEEYSAYQRLIAELVAAEQEYHTE